MATVRGGTKSVLVIVDVQVAVMKEAWDSSRVISNVVTAVHGARSNGVPVIWIQHSDDQLPTGSPEWELTPELSPNPDETIIHKSFASSFEETDLEKILENLEGSHIVLAGAATNFCIRATAYGALDRGYDLTLVSDAHTTGTMELGGKKNQRRGHRC
ncbi:MAG: isochorismatase family protein [Gammaproteobacteria bacterium]|nr:isochorismatase family protein [Gammaproteobacteria bacterium]